MVLTLVRLPADNSQSGPQKCFTMFLEAQLCCRKVLLKDLNKYCITFGVQLPSCGHIHMSAFCLNEFGPDVQPKVTNIFQYGWWRCKARTGDLSHWQRPRKTRGKMLRCDACAIMCSVLLLRYVFGLNPSQLEVGRCILLGGSCAYEYWYATGSSAHLYR